MHTDIKSAGLRLTGRGSAIDITCVLAAFVMMGGPIARASIIDPSGAGPNQLFHL